MPGRSCCVNSNAFEPSAPCHCLLICTAHVVLWICAGQLLRTALFMFLGPALAAILYFLLNSPNSPFVAVKFR